MRAAILAALLLPLAAAAQPAAWLDIPQCALCRLPGPSTGGLVESLRKEYESAARADLRAASLALPLSGEPLAVTLVERLVVGPNETPAVPRGEGRITHTASQDNGAVLHRFHYAQDFDIAGASHTFSIAFAPFREEDGELLEPVKRFAPDHEDVHIQLTGPAWNGTFGSCALAGYPLLLVEAQVYRRPVVDVFRLYVRQREGTPLAVPAGLVLVDAFLPSLGVTQREIDEPSALALLVGTFGKRFLVRLEPPVGGVAFVALGSGLRSRGHFCGAQAVYLDEQFAVIEAPRVWQYSERFIGERAAPASGSDAFEFRSRNTRYVSWAPESDSETERRASLRLARDTRSVVCLRDGDYRLPLLEQGSLEIVDRVLLPPDGRIAAFPSGPGMLSFAMQSSLGYEQFTFSVRQTVAVEKETFDLTITLPVYRTLAGVAVDPVQDRLYRCSATLIGAEWTLSYAEEDFAHLDLYRREARTAAGGVLEFFPRRGGPCEMIGVHTRPENLVRARISLDGRTWLVDDPFSLLVTFIHHNIDERFAARLVPPLGAAHYVAVYKATYDGKPPYLELLDADLRLLETREVESSVESPADDVPEVERPDVALY